MDLRHVNKYLYKFGVKYEGLDVLKNYAVRNSFMVKFDLKSGYHHVGIYEPHKTYLGFSWNFGDGENYFVFEVLPFGLSTAWSIFP